MPEGQLVDLRDKLSCSTISLQRLGCLSLAQALVAQVHQLVSPLYLYQTAQFRDWLGMVLNA